MAKTLEHMQFGFTQTDVNMRMYMDVPTTALEQLQAREDAAKRLRWAGSNRVRLVDIEQGDDAARLYLNFKKFGNTSPEDKKCIAGHELSTIINNVQDFATDPLIHIDIGATPTSLGRYSLLAELLWPEGQNDARLQALCSSVMRMTAIQVKYVPKQHIADFVYAHISRERGVSLIVNDVGGCELDTYGGYYKPSEPKLELSAGNLYHPDMQFICMSGAVALAHATEFNIE